MTQPRRILRIVLFAAAAVATATLLPAAIATASGVVSTHAIAVSDVPLPGNHDVPVVWTSGTGDVWVSAGMADGSVEEPGVQVAYQWVRVSGATVTPIAGATSADYQLTQADASYRIAVIATITKPGFETLELQSLDHDIAVHVPVLPTIETSSDPFGVGSRLQIPDFGLQNEGAPFYSAGLEYQWLRDDVPIPGATEPMYVPALPDLNKRISLRVTVIPSGLLPATFTTAKTVPIPLGVQRPYAIPYVTGGVTSPTGKYFQLQANTYFDPVPGATMTIRWYRDAVQVAPISKYSTHLYQLSPADYGHKIKVAVTMTRPGYLTLTQSSLARDYSIVRSTPVPVIVGDPIPGQELRLDPYIGFEREVVASPDTQDITANYTWYRSGIAIANSNGDSYTLTAADLGKNISVGVVATEQGFLGTSFRSAATQVIRANLFDGYNQQATVTQSGLVLTAVSGITTPGTTLAYQWYRASTAIAKATKSTYTLTSADWGKGIRVRVVAIKTNFTVAVKYSVPIDYSVRQDAIPTVAGASGWRVGEIASVAGQSYVTKDGPLSPTLTYQWYRSGVAIKGAVSGTYAIASADYAKRLSVRIVASAAGYLPLAYTTALGPVIAKGVTTNSGVAQVQMSAATSTLTASLVPGSLVPAAPLPTLTYQWMRDAGTPITGATKASYRLTSADTGHTVWVRINVVRANFTVPSTPVTSPALDYSMTLSDTGYLNEDGYSSVTWAVGRTVKVEAYYDIGVGYAAVDSATYQWYRGATAIRGATAQGYRMQSADLGSIVSVRVVGFRAGYAPFAHTVSPGVPVAKGVVPIYSWLWPWEYKPNVMTLTGALPLMNAPDYASFSYHWLWLSDGVPIPGQTNRTLQMVSARDRNHFISLRMTVYRTGYETDIWESDAHSFSFSTAGAPTVDNPNPHVGDVLHSVQPGCILWEGSPAPCDAFDGPTYYQWYVGNVAVASRSGGTAATFRVPASALGKTIAVSVRYTIPGYFGPPAQKSGPTSAVAIAT